MIVRTVSSVAPATRSADREGLAQRVEQRPSPGDLPGVLGEQALAVVAIVDRHVAPQRATVRQVFGASERVSDPIH